MILEAQAVVPRSFEELRLGIVLSIGAFEQVKGGHFVPQSVVKRDLTRRGEHALDQGFFTAAGSRSVFHFLLQTLHRLLGNGDESGGTCQF